VLERLAGQFFTCMFWQHINFMKLLIPDVSVPTVWLALGQRLMKLSCFDLNVKYSVFGVSYFFRLICVNQLKK
jgi:hypothetical protein